MEVAGVELVECPAYHLHLTQKSCADNWESVAGKPLHTLLRLHHCLGCPIGAERAGKAAVPTPLPRFCCRCKKLSPRLIARRLCPSCYNRERELRVGKNARGTPCVKFTPVETCVVGASINQEQMKVEMVASSCQEVALFVFRTDVSAVIVREATNVMDSL